MIMEKNKPRKGKTQITNKQIKTKFKVKKKP